VQTRHGATGYSNYQYSPATQRITLFHLIVTFVLIVWCVSGLYTLCSADFKCAHLPEKTPNVLVCDTQLYCCNNIKQKSKQLMVCCFYNSKIEYWLCIMVVNFAFGHQQPLLHTCGSCLSNDSTNREIEDGRFCPRCISHNVYLLISITAGHMHKNLVNTSLVVFELCEPADRQTSWHIYHNTSSPLPGVKQQIFSVIMWPSLVGGAYNDLAVTVNSQMPSITGLLRF